MLEEEVLLQNQNLQNQNISYRLRSFDEDLGCPQLELVLIHVDGAQQVQDALALLAPPLGPGLSGQDGVPADRQTR